MMRDYLQPTSGGATLSGRRVAYRSSAPRGVLALTAVAMAAITFSAMVVLPATLDGMQAEPSTLLATSAAARAPVGAASSGACVNVPAEIEPEEQASSNRDTVAAQDSFGRGQFSRSLGRTRI